MLFLLFRIIGTLCLATGMANLMAVTSAHATAATPTSVTVDAGVPTGFEQLNAPRATAVTLHYGGDTLGVFVAHFAPGMLRFDRPDEVVKAIPNLKNPQHLSQMLAQPLPTHPELICGQRHREDCGLLSPEIVGVIFDEDHLSAELFINNNEVTVSNSTAQRYLPLPERKFSAIDSIGGAITGTDNSNPTYAVTNTAVYAFGESKLDTQTTLSDQGLRMDTASASMERHGWSANGGLFRNQSLQLLGDRDIGGLSVQTSTHTLVDAHKTEGNAVILYLPRRSFVSILREGHIYSSRTYEAGNQTIDTSELPEGAYEITLRIQEPDGTTREEKRFFAKNQSLPPPDEPTYYLQAGMVRQIASVDHIIPHFTSDPVLGGGTVQRIDDDLGVSLDLLGVRDRALVQPGLFWLNNGGQVGAGVMTSTSGDMGIQFNFLENIDKFSVAADIRKLWLSDKPIPGYDDVARRMLQGSGTLAYSVTTDLSLGVRGSYAQSSDTATTASIGPYAEWRIWQEGEDLLSASADAARADGQYQGSAFLRFTHRIGDYGVNASVGNNVGASDRGPLGNVRVWHDDHTAGNSLLVGAGFSGDRNGKTVSSDADWRNEVGQMRGSVQESVGVGGTTFGYGGNFLFNLAQAEDELHFGGEQSDRSAVVVSIEGDTDTDMNILVNGMVRAHAHVGAQQVIYLTPFHTYNIRLVPVKKALLNYDNNDRKVVLYPGNVSKLQWTVNRFYVVTARIILPDGTPLTDGILQESRAQVTTDERGRIQAELTKPQTLTFARDTGDVCRVMLPTSKPVNGVLMYKHKLTCEALTKE